VQLSGRGGSIRSILVEEDSPVRRVRKWAWIPPPPPGALASVDERKPLLREDSTITMTYTQSKDEDGQVWTQVDLEHAGLPVEWLDDMETWWRYQLAFMEQLASEQYGNP
ncbi:MAG: hypothetical protein M3O70_16525, partial [Actinomycetota bacterium]|nr:hypothetical protein [Actinomycetota bacterium]